MNIELINKYKFIEQKLAEWIRIMLILIVNVNVTFTTGRKIKQKLNFAMHWLPYLRP